MASEVFCNPPLEASFSGVFNYFTETKQDVGDDALRLIFHEHLSYHEDTVFIYTDGSKSNAGVGFGVIFPDFSRSGRLPNQSSVFTAECYAILTALKEIVSHSGRHFTILSDSRSVLQALGHFNNSNPVILEILEWLRLTQCRGQSVSFLLVSSPYWHCGQ